MHPNPALSRPIRYYGDALRELGVLLNDAKFLEASLLRYETALEKDATNRPALHARAKAQLELVQRALSRPRTLHSGRADLRPTSNPVSVRADHVLVLRWSCLGPC